MRFQSLIAFFAAFGSLVGTQIVLRKLGIIFPVDLSAYVVLLSIQFLTMALAYLVFAFFPKTGSFRIVLSLVMALQAVVLVILSMTGEFLVVTAIAFFLISAAQSVLFYRIFLNLSSSGNFPRLNFLIYSGSAFGLLVAEKVVFQLVPLSHVLWGLGLLQLVMAIAYVARAKNRNLTLNLASLPRPKVDFKHLFSAFLAGYILFSGLIVAFRLLRIYLRDTASVTAEVTAISMIIGAFVSLRFVKLTGNRKSPQFYLLLVGPLLFILAGQNLHKMTGIPREIFILILLSGLSSWASFIFNKACSESQDSRQVTLILLWNTLGSFCGALSFGYFIIPALKLEVAFRIFTVIFASATVGLLIPEIRRILDQKLRPLAAAAVGIFVFLVLVSLLSVNWYQNQVNALVQRLVPGEVLKDSVETPQDLWALTTKQMSDHDLYYRLIHNSHSMSGTLFPSRRYMKLMAYLGFLYGENAKTALNIGFGTGLTAQALLENRSLSKLDVSDVTRDIEKLTRTIFEHENSANPLKDSRLRYHLGGARHYLRTHAEKYDIISGEPPPPSNSSVAYLYTAEFYQEILNHLAPGGVFTYWLPTHSVSDAAAEKIWKTFVKVFPHADLYAGTETNLIMVGYVGPSRLPLRNAKFIDAQFKRETNLQSLADVSALLIASEPNTKQTVGAVGSDILTDDFSYIEEDYGRTGRRPWGLPDFAARPLVYSVETAANHYTGLVALEKVLPTRPALSVIEWLMGIDYRAKAIIQSSNLSADHPQTISLRFAEFLFRADHSGALKYLSGVQNTINADEKLFAYVVLLERMQNLDVFTIQRNVTEFARRRGGVSQLFRNFVERKLPPGFYGN